MFQLDGGIIKYAQTVNEQGEQNKFKGVNFVFDERLLERISEDVVANCHQCHQPFDVHKNCKNDACQILFVQCKSCETIYDSCCSVVCADFIKLPKAERTELRKTTVFNGTVFGRSRYNVSLL